MTDQLWLDALLCATTTVVMSLSAKQFGLYNLAGGAWLMLGGWLGAWLMSPLTGVKPPISPLMFLLFVPSALIQVLSPYLLRGLIQTTPLSHMFISVGNALYITVVGQSMLQDTSGATIPYTSHSELPLFAAALLVASTVYYVYRNRHWARCVIKFRLRQYDEDVWKPLSGLFALEIALLMILGATSVSVHKGVFGASEYRAIIPILALIAMQTSVARAALLSFIIVAGSHVLVLWLGIAPGYAVSVAIGLLGVIIALVSLRPNAILLARKTDEVPADEVPVERQRFLALVWRNEYLSGALVLAVLLLTALLLDKPADEGLQMAMWAASVVLVAHVSDRYLGVASVNWPALGTFALYLVLLVPSVGPSIALLALVVIAWSAYVFLLRLLNAKHALVLDLGMLILLQNLITNSTIISGANNVKIFALGSNPIRSSSVPLWTEIIVSGSVLALLTLAGQKRGLRARVLALGNLSLAYQNGYAAVPLLAVTAALTGIVTIASTTAYHVARATLTPAEVSLGHGLTILLLGKLVTQMGASAGFVAVFFLYVFLDFVFLRNAAWLELVVSVCFVALAFLPKLVGESR
jgi:hypothetical protein